MGAWSPTGRGCLSPYLGVQGRGRGALSPYLGAQSHWNLLFEDTRDPSLPLRWGLWQVSTGPLAFLPSGTDVGGSWQESDQGSPLLHTHREARPPCSPSFRFWGDAASRTPSQGPIWDGRPFILYPTPTQLASGHTAGVWLV